MQAVPETACRRRGERHWLLRPPVAVVVAAGRAITGCGAGGCGGGATGRATADCTAGGATSGCIASSN